MLSIFILQNFAVFIGLPSRNGPYVGLPEVIAFTTKPHLLGGRDNSIQNLL